MRSLERLSRTTASAATAGARGCNRACGFNFATRQAGTAPRVALFAARPARVGVGVQHRHHGVSDPTSRGENRPRRVRGSLTPWLAVRVSPSRAA